ncbi:MAG: hypothetical protein EOP52_13800 [Sphingobacteriales bacterium]|nr:MAG: hypothetical protein EOP52_13800 [Sphingobacteriales bacterium]
MHATTQADLRANGAPNTTTKTFLRFFALNPGFHTVWVMRQVNHMYPKGGLPRLLARLLWLYNTRFNGCYISPLAKIGAGLELRHPIGIVIGEGAVVGTNASIYQHVTLGQKGNTDPTAYTYPVLEDNVTVYAGACILGGITIGQGATIGANSVVMKNVPANSTAVGAPARILK